MPERTRYAPGTLCWIDLDTSDQEGAKRFYEGLFGWQGEDMPVDESTTYTMFRLGGRDVAAVSPLGAQEREMGIPPHWNTYLSVEDADAAAGRVGELGGTVLAEPFDVFDAGRMGIALDPAGAAVLLWQPGRHPGAGVVNEPGAWCWNTLSVPDPEVVKGFYTELAGWSYMDAGDGATVIMLGDARVAGIQVVPAEQDVPPNWTVTFAVEEIEAGHAAAQAAGARTIMPPVDIGIGRFSVLTDPQGAVFSLYAGELDP